MRPHLLGFYGQAWMLGGWGGDRAGRREVRSQEGGKRACLVSVFISRLLSGCGLIISTSLSSLSTSSDSHLAGRRDFSQGLGMKIILGPSWILSLTPGNRRVC